MKTKILDYSSLPIPSDYTDTVTLLTKDGKFYYQTPGGGGGSSDAVTVSLVATEDLPAFSVVTSKGKNADSSVISGIEKVLGISQSAIANGFSGDITVIGEITNPGWSFVAGDVLYLNGASLSTVAPSTGFTQKIGTAKTSTTVYVSLGEAVLL
jgi:hypothetical protein